MPGSCCQVHKSPGCSNHAVSDCVCASDPFCCTGYWDEQCVDDVSGHDCGVCPGTGGTGGIGGSGGTGGAPPAGSCCEVHDEPSCDSPRVSFCVCAQDPYCCDTAWDWLCVDEVTEYKCGVCEPETGGAGGSGGGQTGGVGAAGGASSLGSCCEPHQNAGCEQPDVSACVCDKDPYCCTTAWDIQCVQEAVTFGCTRCAGGAGGEAGAGGTGGTGGVTGAGGLGGTGGTSGTGGAAGSDTGGSAGTGGTVSTGTCCSSHSEPGCDDPDAMACLCGGSSPVDPYCCETQWDSRCVQELTEYECGACPGIGGVEECLHMATGVCQPCLCETCFDRFVSCFADEGCWTVFVCMGDTQCEGYSCNSANKCGDDIKKYGGFNSAPVQAALATVQCGQDAGCECP
jgi:hypothetical protein